MRSTTDSQTGFTLMEFLTVMSIMALVIAISLPLYQDYTDRARASEIIQKFDALRTNVATDFSGGMVDDCNVLARGINDENLSDDYAELAVGFEAVAGSSSTNTGFRPVLTVCARDDAQGTRGVRVARATLEELSAQHLLEGGAVVTNSIVSFALPLTAGKLAACGIAPSTPLAGCRNIAQTSPAQAQPLRAPTQVQPSLTAAPQMLRQGVPQCIPPANVMVQRPVMQFGGGAQGYIVNEGNLNTGGDMTSLTVEMAFMGGTQVATSGSHGATILSYASTADDNEFSVWNPESLTINFGNEGFDTNLDINDGQSHRLTVSWDSTTGAIHVFDNGISAWTGTGHRGGIVRGNGKLALGGDQDSYGGGFSNEDSFRGAIVSASLANRVVPDANIQRGPINTAIDSSSGLVTSVVATAQGFEDSTGQYRYSSGAGMSTSQAQVPSSLYVSDDCS